MSNKKNSNKIKKDAWGHEKIEHNNVRKEKKILEIKDKCDKKNNLLNLNYSSYKNKKKKNFFVRFKKIFTYVIFIFLFFWMLTGLYLIYYSNQKTRDFFWRISNFIQPEFNWNKKFERLLDLTDYKNVKSKIVSFKLITKNNCKVQVKIEFCYEIFNPTQYFLLVKEKKINFYLNQALFFCSKRIIAECLTDDILSSKIIDIQKKIFNEICKQKTLYSIGVHGKEIKVHSIKLIDDYIKELNIL
ncbi:hypothetical protein [Buchnera aphidicola]|uniref:Uncharacterized protein n=1 Tax=Buchnera aphidicola (Anoecia oenotherae) TaxID=1241833 RepID=A0A4D6XRR7_9GAMM|nr:hypothetical protein [Buchnera aphidicola]QCI19556.1 hypothetical protein D9V65_02310 [Buchnera aphidicola (Anoecia oenotherae)]